MPIVNRRAKNSAASRTAFLVAAAFHIIVAVVFWNTGGDKIVKDFVAEVITGKSQAPPPPPKPKIKQQVMAKPQSIIPKFEVKSTTRIDPGFAPVFKEISSISSDMGPVNFTSMAQSYSVKSFSLDKSQISNVTDQILSVIGVGDLLGDRGGIKVSGVGKRMRARLNLCLISTPGATIVGATGRSSGRKIAVNQTDPNKTSDQDTIKTRVTWDYLLRKYHSIEKAREWLGQNTQIQVTENTITLNFEKSYTEWVAEVRKKGAQSGESGGQYHESNGLKAMEKSFAGLEVNRISGRRDFVQTIRSAVYSYFQNKYDIKEADILPADMILKKIEDRNVLREWRKRGLTDILQVARSVDPEWSEDRLVSAVYPLYLFLRKAQALENPLIIVANIIGLNKLSEENLEILRNYVKNGGFIWIDDTGVATENINNQHNNARTFIHSVMSFDETETLSSKEQETFHKLTSDDRNVQGFKLGEPFPPFAHPQVFIPVELPQDAPVSIRIFNRLGIPVKQFVWSKEKPMRAGTYTTKERALSWNCDNNDGEPVESGTYFIQMESGLYQKTKIYRVGKLRMLDEKHPLMSVVHNFRNVPVCTIESGSSFWVSRPYGNAAFGYYLNGRMAILYTEGAGIFAGMGDLDNPVGMDRSSKFLNNVIAFCLSDEDGVAIRP